MKRKQDDEKMSVSKQGLVEKGNRPMSGRDWECIHCGETFPSNYLLKKHEKEAHNINTKKGYLSLSLLKQFSVQVFGEQYTNTKTKQFQRNPFYNVFK